MSSALRLWTTLAVLALALGAFVWSSIHQDRRLNEQWTESMQSVVEAEKATREWSDQLLREISLQLGQSFLMGVGTLEDLDEETLRLLEDRILMVAGGQTDAGLEEALREARRLVLDRLDDLTELTPEQSARLRERLETFTLGSRDEPVVQPKLRGPIESVLVIDNENRIIASSDETVEGQTFQDQDEVDRIEQARDRPVTHRLRLADDKLYTEVYVPLRVRDRLLDTERTVGVLKFRYRGSLAAIPPTRGAPPVDFPKLPLSLWAAVVAGLLGLGFGILATRRVSQLTRALEDLARGPTERRRPARVRGDAAFRALAVMEERFESLEEGARDQSRILEWLTGSLEEGVAVLEPDASPRSLNHWVLESLELGPEAGARDAFGRLLELNPSLRSLVDEAAERGVGVRNRDLDLRLPGGGARGLRLTLYALKEDDEVSGLVLLFRDLASIRRLERALREASRLETLVHLSRSVAHEIKNPLGSVVIHLGLLQRRFRGSAADDEARDRLQTIQEEVSRIDGTIREYLGMTGPEDKDRGPADLNATLSRIAHFLRVEAREAEVSIVTELAPGLPPVGIPPSRLKEAIMNLALNGIQSMPLGGRLTLRSQFDGDGVLTAEIEDEGVGISSTIRERVFELHFTTKDGGSGLGLAITRQILEEGGGSVDFISEEGRGSVFRAYLPVFRGRARTAAAETGS